MTFNCYISGAFLTTISVQNVSKWIFERKVSSITCGGFDSSGYPMPIT